MKGPEALYIYIKVAKTMATQTTVDIITYFDERILTDKLKYLLSCHDKLSINFLQLKITELGFQQLNICSYLQSY